MILDKTVKINISNQGNHFKNLGYENVKQGRKLIVLVEHLQEKSCIKINCKCDECGTNFMRFYQQVYGTDFHRCYDCSRKICWKNNE